MKLLDSFSVHADVCEEYRTPAALKQYWTNLKYQTTPEKRLHISRAVLADIAQHDRNFSESLHSEYLKEAGSSTAVAELSFRMWHDVVELYPDIERLKVHLQYEAAARTELARLFYGNAPLIMKSLVIVLRTELSTGQVCLGMIEEMNKRVATTIQHIARQVKLQAICYVDEQSGLAEFPIKGNIIFTEPLCGASLSTIMVSLCGFNDTTKHGFHVHEIGSTADGCAAAGPHYNPDSLQHGAPDDIYRHAGDLGNIQADAYGRVITTIKDRIVGLRVPHNVIGRTIVIHRNEDDLGRGELPGTVITGNAGARIACCVIDSCIWTTY